MQSVAPKITIRKATKTITNEELSYYHARKKKVAAYARVSTDEEEQNSSYEAQLKFYTEEINNNPEWEFVEVYADEGITGTNTSKREGFKRMINDCRAGKIDIILTKSISRFARNIVDAINYVRELRLLGIEVFFEKENIHTLDPACELSLSIYATLAQEESRSISENVSWTIEKNMKAGKVVLPYSSFLGYKKGANGKPEIVEEEAVVVREIYNMFIRGYSLRDIADRLDGKGIATPKNKEKWSISTIRSILSNEKYKGDARLGKTFTESFLTKKIIKNTGQKDSYYITGSHPAIIEPAMFDLVQLELEKRAGKGKWANDKFARKIICDDCGEVFGHKTWNDKSKKRYSVWCCNHKYDKKKTDKICDTANLREEWIVKGFMLTVDKILEQKTSRINVCEKRIAKLKNQLATKDFKERMNYLMQEIRALNDEADKLDNEDALYRAHRKEEIRMELESKSAELQTLQKQELEASAETECLNKFISAIEKCASGISEYDKFLWLDLVDKVTVKKDMITYHLMDGDMFTFMLYELK